jgi:hypothetical protein
MELITPLHWKNYELLDCGDFEKLELFGQKYGLMQNGKNWLISSSFQKEATVVNGKR